LNFNIHHFLTLDSTNDLAKQLMEENAVEGTVVWADQQTKGRGQRGRVWISQEGNLFCSIILRPSLRIEDLANLSQFSVLAAVAVGEVLSSFLPDFCQLTYKWPNDVLVNDQKISGILLESSFDDKTVKGVVVGIGINIQTAPENLAYPTAALNQFLSEPQAAGTVLNSLLKSLRKYYAQWQQNEFSAIEKKWLQRIKATQL
jgi:BirA family transcriptional regulator, biotin operon repressor / biotin---[acetyl-CoA-carboxylase] ligase